MTEQHTIPGKVVRFAHRTGLTLAALVTIAAVGAQAASVCFEAESYNQIKAPFKVGLSANASGGKCVYQPLGTGRPPTVKCYAIYHFRVTTPGRYIVWGRGLWPSGCGNSFDVKIDSHAPATIGQDGTYNRWHWVRIRGMSFTLSKGVHTFTLMNREDGPGMDEFYLTTEDEVPVGIIHQTANVIVR